MYKHFFSLSLFAILFSPLFAQQTKKEMVSRMEYLLYHPKDYSRDTSQRWPLVIFLHGAGERGNDIEKVKVHGIPKLIEAGEQFPFIAVSPQCPNGSGWDYTVLDKLLDEVVATNRVDIDRVYLTGLSMGGFGTFSWACHKPGRFAAIAPICGGGNAREAWKIRDLPTWVFHGDSDNVVPIRSSQIMVDTLKAMGYNPRFTVYADVGHNSWDSAYNTKELYTWMLSQKRNPVVQVKIPAEKMNSIQGKYVVGSDTINIKIANNKLLAYPSTGSHQAVEIFSDVPNRYYHSVWWDNKIDFTTDKKNQVTGITITSAYEMPEMKGVKIK